MPSSGRSPRPGGARRRAGGFTLVEAMVAFAILVLATVGMIWSRSAAVEQAAEARNVRLAVKIARETYDFLRAGMNQEDILLLNEWRTREDYQDFAVRVVTGDVEIAGFESTLAEDREDQDQLRRLDLQERIRLDEEYRLAAEPGAEPAPELQDLPLDEENFTEAIIAVRYPTYTARSREKGGEGIFVLRASLSTLALSGRTPEEAAETNAANGRTEGGAGSAGGQAGGTGAPAAGGAGGGGR